jgi:hypothetical protein
MPGDDLPTPRSTLRSRYARVLVQGVPASARGGQALVDAGRGDVPLIKLRFRVLELRRQADRLGSDGKNTGPST